MLEGSHRSYLLDPSNIAWLNLWAHLLRNPPAKGPPGVWQASELPVPYMLEGPKSAKSPIRCVAWREEVALCALAKTPSAAHTYLDMQLMNLGIIMWVSDSKIFIKLQKTPDDWDTYQKTIWADFILHSQSLPQLPCFRIRIDVWVGHFGECFSDFRGWPIRIFIGIQLYNLVRRPAQPAPSSLRLSQLSTSPKLQSSGRSLWQGHECAGERKPACSVCKPGKEGAVGDVKKYSATSMKSLLWHFLDTSAAESFCQWPFGSEISLLRSVTDALIIAASNLLERISKGSIGV